jgi:ACT domain-containing protein
MSIPRISIGYTSTTYNKDDIKNILSSLKKDDCDKLCTYISELHEEGNNVEIHAEKAFREKTQLLMIAHISLIKFLDYNEYKEMRESREKRKPNYFETG